MEIAPVDDKYIGLYIAYVHEHIVEDDGRSLGKVRVVCPPLWGTAVSPECLPATGIGGGGYTRDGVRRRTGLYAVPPVGSAVVIGFFGGDVDCPIYLGGFWGKPDGQFEVPFSPNQTAAEGSPDAVVWETEQWRILIEAGVSPKFRVERVGNEDTSVEIADDGTMIVNSDPSGGQKATITIDGSSGTITIDAGTTVELGGPLAVDALVKGTAFKAFFDAHTHGGVTAGAGISGPPSAPMDTPPGTHLSQKVNTE